MGGRGSKSSRSAGSAPAVDPDVAESKLDADSAEATQLSARANERDAVDAQINGDAPLAKLHARESEASAKASERMAASAEARAATKPDSQPLQEQAARAREAADRAKMNARGARQASQSASRVATGNYRR